MHRISSWISWIAKIENLKFWKIIDYAKWKISTNKGIVVLLRRVIFRKVKRNDHEKLLSSVFKFAISCLSQWQEVILIICAACWDKRWECVYDVDAPSPIHEERHNSNKFTLVLRAVPAVWLNCEQSWIEFMIPTFKGIWLSVNA